MQLLLIKLLLTPLLMIAVSWAARRWGPRVGGLLAGLPLTSGPISIYLWVEQGPKFAATAASSSLLSLTPIAIFSIVYSRLAQRLQMPACALCGLGVFFVSLYFLQRLASGRLPLQVRIYPDRSSAGIWHAVSSSAMLLSFRLCSQLKPTMPNA